MSKLRVLSLFAGIGGFDLGLERTGGFETVAFCEIEPFCQSVLAKHWPGVPCYDDVRTLTAARLASDGISVDCIVGGFPCQDLSRAGSKVGIGGTRSGLWREYHRLVSEIRPSIFIVENVTELLGWGIGTVLGDMASIGYNAEWHRIPASAIGAPHPRERLWIMAYRDEVFAPCDYSAALGLELARRWQAFGELGASSRWNAEPDMGRVVDGIPSELDIDRVGALGNAVVPQIPELIGNAILESMAA